MNKNSILFLLFVCLMPFSGIAQNKMHKREAKILIHTTQGDITIKLYANTPENTNNMIKLVGEHAYDSTLFHRVIPTFMIQGGDPDSKRAQPGAMLGNGGLNYTVPAEINNENFHKKGAVGIARDNNPSKAGNAMQFYLVVGKLCTDAELDQISQQTGRQYTAEQRQVYKTKGGTPFLDGNYTVCGEIISGQEVADKIALLPRDPADRPMEDVRIISMREIK